MPTSNGLNWSDLKRKLLNALKEGADEVSRLNAEEDRAFLDELDRAAKDKEANAKAATPQQPISYRI